jgi:hypothetical protein
VDVAVVEVVAVAPTPHHVEGEEREEGGGDRLRVEVEVVEGEGVDTMVVVEGTISTERFEIAQIRAKRNAGDRADT